jgi:hypothetical protein
MGDAFGREIALFSKQPQASKLGIRQLEALRLILHALLAALEQARDKLMKFI